jgi:hypothetical protein
VTQADIYLPLIGSDRYLPPDRYLPKLSRPNQRKLTTFAFAQKIKRLPLYPFRGLHCETFNLSKDNDKVFTSELQQFFNGRMPHERSSPIRT